MALTTWVVLTAGRASGWWRLDGEERASSPGNQRIRLLARLTFAAMIVGVVAAPGYVLLRLVVRPSLPSVVAPRPNAYDEFIQLGEAIRLPADFRFPTAEVAALEKTIDAWDNAFQRLRRAVDEPCLVEVNYQQPLGVLPGRISNLGVALLARQRLCQLRGDSAGASENLITLVKFEQALTRGASEYEFDAAAGLLRSVDFAATLAMLNARDARRLARVLHEVDSGGEPLDDIIPRGRVVRAYAFDWEARLQQLVGELSGEDLNAHQFRQRYWFREALQRQWMIAAALRACYLERGEIPASLDVLAPDYLPAAPLNPFSSDGAPVEYHRLDAGSASQGATAAFRLVCPTLRSITLDLTFAFHD